MKSVLLALVLVAPAVVVALVMKSRGDEERRRGREGARAPAAGSLTGARLDRLEQHLRERGGRVDDLAAEVDALERAFRESLTRQAGGPERLSVFLDQYVLSFAEGAKGSEFFRLAVDAHATSLLDEIVALLRDPSAPIGLRLRLAQMLSTPRFRGSGTAIHALLGALRTASLASSALKGLGVIGDATTARDIEQALFDLGSTGMRLLAYDVIARLAGPDRNRTLQRLLLIAKDVGERRRIPEFVDASDVRGAIDLFRLAAQGEVPVRTGVAMRLVRLRGPEFARFIDERLAAETDPGVRKILEKAKAAQSKVPSWHAVKATGPPDARPPNRDHPNAWATKQADGGRQWIELGYATPLRASRVRIFEVNVPGAVLEVRAVDESGGRHVLWRGDDPTTVAGVFELAVPTTAYRVRALRIVLDTNRRSGWNEIDAVEIVGPDGRAWARTASASSTYGQ